MAERKERIRVHINNREYYVVGGSFQEMLAAVKQINGRRFVGDLKVWQLPGTKEDIQGQLEIVGFYLEGGEPVAGAAPAPVMSAAPARSASPAPAAAGGDRIRVLIQGHQLAVVGGSFQAMLAAFKGLPGRRFDGNSKMWEIPGELAIIKTLVEAAGFQLEGADQIPAGSADQKMAPVSLGQMAPPPAYEAPDFSDDAEAAPYEPPDWWDDENMPPPVEPPDWWDEDEPLPPAGMPPEKLAEPLEADGGLFDSDDEPSPAGPDQVRIRLGGIPLVISGGSFQQILALVKTFPGRRFDSLDKVWDLPPDMSLEEFKQWVQDSGFILKRF
jgi:hypothetical protein